jgi:hypothetical protein
VPEFNRSAKETASGFFMKNLLLVLCLCSPVALWSQAKLLVDAIPTGASFVGVTKIALPFKDAANENPKDIEAGLGGAISQMLPAASQQGFSYVCLLSAPGDQPVVIHLAAGKADLKLSRTGTAVFALFYKGGHEATRPTAYSTGSPEPKTAHVSVTFKKISVPQGTTTAGWIYFNLPRIQAEAEKEKSATVFLSAGGSGTTTAVPIPGMKEPLLVPEDQSTLAAAWYMDPANAAPHQGEVLGHPIPADAAKPKQ